jgi:hypothetical protein
MILFLSLFLFFLEVYIPVNFVVIFWSFFGRFRSILVDFGRFLDRFWPFLGRNLVHAALENLGRDGIRRAAADFGHFS